MNKLLFFLSIISIQACHSQKQQKTVIGEKTDGIYSLELFPATVIFYEIDGCKWMLKLPNGNKLQPVELDEAFQKDGLKVKIAYREKPDAISICMAGQVVDLIRIIEDK